MHTSILEHSRNTISGIKISDQCEMSNRRTQKSRTSDSQWLIINLLDIAIHVLPASTHAQCCELLIVPNVHHIYTLLQLLIGLPVGILKISIPTSEMDHPGLSNRENL